MIKTYPGLMTYFGSEQQPMLQELEAIARERGISMSVLTRRMVEACAPLLKDKKNRNKIVIEGKITMELVKSTRAGRNSGVSIK